MESIKEAFLRMAKKNQAGVTEQNGLLRMTLHAGGTRDWHAFLSCSEEERLLICYLLFPGTVPSEKSEEAIHKIGALNYDLKFGTFEFGEGEIRFRASQFVPFSLVGADAETFFFQLLQVAAGVAKAGLLELLPLLSADGEDEDVPD